MARLGELKDLISGGFTEPEKDGAAAFSQIYEAWPV